jgi:nitrite reductase/ring-hydroxylating ferredoxin subunit/uncharacterized membrane protein
MRGTGPRRAAETIEELESLDRIATPVAARVSQALAGPAKDVLSGSWLGHPLHPLLTDLPIGAWTSAVFLDVVGGRRAQAAADALVAAGVVTALPTALSGLSDWSDLGRPERRVGVVHAAANNVALALWVASLMARRRGSRSVGVALGLLAATALTAGGYLGGHLAYGKGAGVDRNAFDELPDEWTPLAGAADLPEGQPVLAHAGATDVMLVRRGGTVLALADRCAHLGGPLHKGTVEEDMVTCPWHGSTFRLDDGSVVHGPASAPQPSLEVRSVGGKVEVRRRRSPAPAESGQLTG